MQLSSLALDLAAVRWTVIAGIAVLVGLSAVRRHAEWFARQRAIRVLGSTDLHRRHTESPPR